MEVQSDCLEIRQLVINVRSPCVYIISFKTSLMIANRILNLAPSLNLLFKNLS